MPILKNKLIGLTLVILGLSAPAVFLPFTPWFVALFERISHLRFWGPAALTGFCILASVLPIPAVIPILAAGFLFGVLTGSLVSEIGTTIGASVAFLLARTIGRDWVAGRIPLGSRFARLDRAVGEQGFKIVLLSRLSPIAPFISVNYAFGLTRVSFGQYAWGTLIGGAPGTILFVVFGAALHSLREVIAYAGGQDRAASTHWAFFWASLVITAVVVVWLTYIAHRALRKAQPNEPTPPGQNTTPAQEPRRRDRFVGNPP